MKKQFWIIIILGVIILVLLGALAWPKANNNPQPAVKGIEVTSPKANEEVSLPIKITGYVNGDGWIGFEGQVGNVSLVIGGDMVLAQVPLTAKGEWMTTDPINFEANITELLVNCSAESNCVIDGPAELIFHNENPSGDAEKNKTFTLPIKIKKSTPETMVLKAYFGNSVQDPQVSCNKVFAVERTVAKTESVARTALEELFKGPTAAEIKSGFFTSINKGVKIQSLTIVDGTAKVDFNEQLQFQVGGSCKVSAIRAEITETLKQFPTVKNVIISINGKTEDILQP